MTPQLRHELERTKQAIDQEIKNMRGQGNGGGDGRPSWMARRAAPAALPEATGWSVPIEISTRDGNVTVYLSFPPESFNEAENIIEALVSEGCSVKAWRPKQHEDRGGGRGGYGGGGYGRDRDDRGGDRGGYGGRGRY